MTLEESIEAQIRRLGFDLPAAQKLAREGKIEEWVHRYLLAGPWANPAFAVGLKLEKRWWRGPVEVALSALSRAVGPEAGMEYPVSAGYWVERTQKLASTLTDLSAIPPLIVEYRAGILSVRDGNTRMGAMELLGWPRCWVIFWYTSERDFNLHSCFDHSKDL